MVNLTGKNTEQPPRGGNIEAALHAAADDLETSLWNFQMAQQASQEQAKNHFLTPQTVFQTTIFPYKSSSWKRKWGIVKLQDS